MTIIGEIVSELGFFVVAYFIFCLIFASLIFGLSSFLFCLSYYGGIGCHLGFYIMNIFMGIREKDWALVTRPGGRHWLLN